MKTFSLVSLASISCALGLAACSGGAPSDTSAASATSASSTIPNPSCSMAGHAVVTDYGKHLQVSAQGLQKLHGHVPREVSEAQDGGKSDESQMIPVTVSLQLNNEAELSQRLVEMYRPGSPTYHRFMTPAEFHSRYAPTDAQLRQVEDFLESEGFGAVSVDENRLLVRAIAPVGQVNSTFHTELHEYLSAKGESFRAPAYELQIPAGLPVLGVHGLQTLTKLHTHLVSPASGANPQRAGSGPSGGYSPGDIRAAYNIPAGLDGSGQTLALFELDGYRASDVQAYEQKFGLPSVPLKNVLVNGFNGSVGGGQAEVTLDIELMIALAPNAKQILVYEGTNDDQGILATYSKIANDNLASSVSASWGDSEGAATSSFLQSENKIFMQMAAQGQSMYAAAGDNGAYDNGSTLSVDDPGSQPYVTGVGGTTLTTGSSGAYGSETTWNGGNAGGSGGGGGVSSIWPMPSWQTGLSKSGSKISSTMRNVPDVALDSDPNTGYSIYTGGGWTIFGGTSCAAPLWAAYTALVNQQRAAYGQAPLGFANPVLYQVAQGSRYGSDFFDIKDGSTNQYYPAISGYDDATGWGSFNGTSLLQDLAQDPQASTPAPAPTESCPSSS